MKLQLKRKEELGNVGRKKNELEKSERKIVSLIRREEKLLSFYFVSYLFLFHESLVRWVV